MAKKTKKARKTLKLDGQVWKVCAKRKSKAKAKKMVKNLRAKGWKARKLEYKNGWKILKHR